MSEQNQPTARPHHGIVRRRVTGLVLGALAAVLAAENTQPVAIRVLVPVVTMPVWAALMTMFALGVSIGLLVNRGGR